MTGYKGNILTTQIDSNTLRLLTICNTKKEIA